MKIDKIYVSRNLEVPGQQNVEVGTTVSFRKAENADEMVTLAGGNLFSALEYFNSGRWAELRTKTSNALAGKSDEQKAVDKMISALKTINPSLSDEQARSVVLTLPNMADAAKVAGSKIPTEIEDTYFDTKKAEKAAAKQG